MEQGYVIIKHQVFGEITDAEVLAQLPKTENVPVYRIFDIKREIISMENIHQLDSLEFRIYQKNIFESEIKPFLNDHPDYKVMYFGTATIPLALHFGYCFGSWKDVDVFLLHREHMTWGWSNSGSDLLPMSIDFVNEEFPGPIDVLYKVEATYSMQESELSSVVQNPHKVIGLKLDNAGKDAFKNQQQLKAFAFQFSRGLDAVASYLPAAEKIHLFPTVPVGLAFLCGTKINPLVTKPIVTYQYDANRTPKHEQILILQEAGRQEANMTEEDKVFIGEVKSELKAELENQIATFASSKREEKEKHGKPSSWIQFILPPGNYSEMERGYWRTMPDIAETILNSSTLSLACDLAGDGFYISENNEWQINDRFIFNIMTRLGRDKKSIHRALRMFVFHESLHLHQALTNHTALNIGRFPRVLEEADYLADVWAIIHEYSYSKMFYSQDTKNEKEFFKLILDLATKTMWAFDDLDPNTEEMQIRRVNRYLIWYWNYLQIEDRGCQSLEQILTILANKPLVEIRGLDIRAQAQRTIYRFTGFKTEELEFAYLELTGRIRRASNAGGFQLNEVIRGFRERNGEKIIQQLKSWYHQIRE